ncbi:transposase [Pseudomonas sp. RW407]|uniref:zonular occludens toxin domain-containing protein n=1 Tax=Pseudomonas sp. RW407 TaxID=2202894 RepID=UPI000D7039CF|nr:zonular occludens toxin domain-containing protein [Pseudomonas sp. RW407]PWU31376.1 transposase [Pseudomonas sp. RW407]
MLKLATGRNGAGKTSNELWDFLYNKRYEGRPKFCTKVKGFEPEKHGVTLIEDLTKWRELPAGALVFVDEVQDYLGARSGREVPEWINEFAKHRHKGYDFIFTTPSPMMLDPFVRGLIGLHVHYSKPWNIKTFRRKWETVQPNPDSKQSKRESSPEVVRTNLKVFEIYTSTEFDTHKPRPPWKLIAVLVAALIALIGGGSYAYYTMNHISDKPEGDSVTSEVKSSDARVNPAPSGGSVGAVVNNDAGSVVWSLETVQPRIPGMPWTAPIYDQLTKPSDFPRIAGCVKFQTGPCRCFTQQGTPISMAQAACLVNIKEGMFDPWRSSRRQQAPQQVAQAPSSLSPAADSPTRLFQQESAPQVVPVTVVPDTEYSSRPWRSASAGAAATYVQSGGSFDYVPR